MEVLLLRLVERWQSNHTTTTMTLREIIDMPTVLSPKYVEEIFELEPGTIDNYRQKCTGIHESNMRSYQELVLVKDLLVKKVHPDVILDILELLDTIAFEKNPKGESV